MTHLQTTADLEEVDKTGYTFYEIDESCELLAFFNKRNITFWQGRAFYELQNETEDIPRSSIIILIDKVVNK